MRRSERCRFGWAAADRSARPREEAVAGETTSLSKAAALVVSAEASAFHKTSEDNAVKRRKAPARGERILLRQIIAWDGLVLGALEGGGKLDASWIQLQEGDEVTKLQVVSICLLQLEFVPWSQKSPSDVWNL